jgi:hypothetical protein
MSRQGGSVLPATAMRGNGTKTSPKVELFHGRRLTANEHTAAFGFAAIYGHWHTVRGECATCTDDLIDSVRLTARIRLWTVDRIAKPGDCPSANVVRRRATDDGSAVVGFVTYCNYF